MTTVRPKPVRRLTSEPAPIRRLERATFLPRPLVGGTGSAVGPSPGPAFAFAVR